MVFFQGLQDLECLHIILLFLEILLQIFVQVAEQISVEIVSKELLSSNIIVPIAESSKCAELFYFQLKSLNAFTWPQYCFYFFISNRHPCIVQQSLYQIYNSVFLRFKFLDETFLEGIQIDFFGKSSLKLTKYTSRPNFESIFLLFLLSDGFFLLI